MCNTLIKVLLIVFKCEFRFNTGFASMTVLSTFIESLGYLPLKFPENHPLQTSYTFPASDATSILPKHYMLDLIVGCLYTM